MEGHMRHSRKHEIFEKGRSTLLKDCSAAVMRRGVNILIELGVIFAFRGSFSSF